MTRLSLAILASLALATSAQAASESDFLLENAGNLAALCSSPSEPAAIHMCQGYLVGVNHMHAAISEALDKRVYCLPNDGTVTRDTAAQAFAAWVAATPGAAEMPAREGLLKWASTTYPCS